MNDDQVVLFIGQSGTKGAQVFHVSEAVFEHGLADEAVAPGHAGQGHDTGLQVRREARIEVGDHIDGRKLLRPQDPGLLAVPGDLDPHLLQLGLENPQMFRTDPFQRDISGRDGARHHQQASVQPVVHHGVLGSVQVLDPGDLHGARARALYPGAHLGEQFDKIPDLRVGSRIFDQRLPGGQTGGHDQVFRPGVRGNIAVHEGALQTPGTDLDTACLQAFNCRPQADEPAVVDIPRSLPDDTPPHLRNAGLAKTRHKRPHEQDGGAEAPGQILGQIHLVHSGRIDEGHFRDRIVIDRRPQAAQHVQSYQHILDRRHPVQNRLPFRGQQGGRNHGQSRIFRPLHDSFAAQRSPAFYIERFFSHWSLQDSSAGMGLGGWPTNSRVCRMYNHARLSSNKNNDFRPVSIG